MASSMELPRPWRAGADMMGNVALSDYIRLCLPAAADVPGVFCNSKGTATRPPILRRGVPNTIIVFPGRFNPPNINHAQLLRHVTRNAGQDLNIIGAMVYLRDELEVYKKLTDIGEDFAVLLDEEERTDMWNGTGIPVDWVWVLSRFECQWNHLHAALSVMAEQDGFDLRFLLLCGPENFAVLNDYNEPEDPARWGCSGWITSDIGRSADFVFASIGEPVAQSEDCTRWERAIPKARDVRAIARGKFMLNGPEDLKEVTAAEIRDEGRRISATAARDWMCRRTVYPKGPVRFVPSPPDHQRLEVTSAEIRQVIRSVQIQHLPGIEPALAPIALHVRFLLSCSAGWKDKIFLHEFDWGKWGDGVQERLAVELSMGGHLEKAEDTVPDEWALYLADMNPAEPNAALQEINPEIPVSAIRSTLLTHADGAAFGPGLAPTRREIWGPNTYLNEDDRSDDRADDQGGGSTVGVPVYPFALPEV